MYPMLTNSFKLLCLFALLLGHGLRAKVIYVDDNASEGGDGSSWATAHKYLQDALAVAEYGDEIWVAEGTYKPDQGEGMISGSRITTFILVDGVMMIGGFLGIETSNIPFGENNKTFLSGRLSENEELWSYHIISSIGLSNNTSMKGFTVSNGNANGGEESMNSHGAGIYILDSSIKIEGCIFEKNKATGSGGAMYCENSSPTILDCLFLQNSRVYPS